MNRIKWLDVTKGIGILLVIFGHLFRYGGIIFTWIFSFHMPLFFFCAGFVFNQYSNFKFFLYKKVKSLIIPWFIFSIIGLTFTMLIPYYRDLFSIEELKHYLVIAQPENINVGQVWFLICLFWVELIFYFLFKLLKGNTYLLLISTIIISYIAKYIPVLCSDRLPLKIDSSVIGLFFYELGYLFNKISNSIKETKKSNFITAIILFLVSLLAIKEPTINVCLLNYSEKYYEFLFFAIIGIGMIIAFSKVFQSCKFLGYLGKNSLIIFGTHSLGLRGYQVIYKCIYNKEIHIMSDMTYPQILKCGIFTIILTILISFLYNKWKNKLTYKLKKDA